MKYFLILIVIILVVGIVIYFSCCRAVERRYFEKAMSLSSGYSFSRIREVKGEPIDESWIEFDGWYYKQLVYEGYVFRTRLIEKPDYAREYYTDVVYITDPSYRIGFSKVGIGSTKKEVKRAYLGIQRIVDIEEENVIGFVDGAVWVEFRFAEDKRVDQIFICNGP